MTEPQPSTLVFLAALTDAERAGVAAHLTLGKTNLAATTLRQAAPSPDPRMIAEALVVLAARAGVELVCPMCGEGPAAVRDDYLFLPLCDDCSAKYMTSPCPDCGAQSHLARDIAHEVEGRPCMACEPKRTWAALPQETRDEIDQAVASLSNVMAIKRIRELIRCDGLREAILLHNLRHQERDAVG